MANSSLSLILPLLVLVATVCTGSLTLRSKHDLRGIETFITRNGDLGMIRRSTPVEEFLYMAHGRNRRESCKCRCRSRYHGDREWHCCACTFSQRVCFPGSAIITMYDGTKVRISDLQRGDRVMTVHEGILTTTEVTSFMQRNTTGLGKYLTLSTDDTTSLTLSYSHLVYSSTTQNGPYTYKYAKDVNVGDWLHVHSNNSLVTMAITHIDEVLAEGAYTPLTTHGTILVDDVLASCYASFHHDLAHIFMSPMRWFPSILDAKPEAEGMRAYVRLLRDIGRWVLPEGLQNESGWLSAEVHKIQDKILTGFAGLIS